MIDEASPDEERFRYRYDALDNLLSEEALSPGGTREGRQFYPGDRGPGG